MKYKKGTPTLLGKIKEVDTSCTSMPYLVFRDDTVGHWFTESEIDAIICKPKRNIDHLIELIEAKDREETEKFIQDNQSNSSWGFWRGMLNPYAEPRKYPVLTPYELKAVKWLVEGGYETIRRCTGGWATIIRSEDCRTATENLPLARLLSTSTWITTEPINLKELLEAQEDV